MGLFDFCTKVWHGGLNAANRGVLGLQVDPRDGDMHVTVNGRVSPAMDRFSVQAGDAVNALVILYKAGAQCYGSSLKYAEQNADREAHEFAARYCEPRMVGSRPPKC